MPNYDYRCSCCDIVFEVSRPMGSKADEFCPQCGQQAARVFTPVGVAFKGSGFHNTDYRSKPAAETSTACASEKSTTCAASG